MSGSKKANVKRPDPLPKIAKDIEQRPEALKPLSADFVARMELLAKGIKVDLDEPIDGDVDLGYAALSDVLGESLLEILLSSATNEAADRMRFLEMVVADLSGSYNAVGIRRWFERPRTQLSGKSPREALSENWHPTSPAAQCVRVLAASLAPPPDKDPSGR